MEILLSISCNFIYFLYNIYKNEKGKENIEITNNTIDSSGLLQ